MKNKKQNVHIDVPYHMDFLRKDEFDNRRHKSRCKFYNKDTKKCHCPSVMSYLFKCCGAAHCEGYNEEDDEDIIKMNMKRKPNIIIENDVVISNRTFNPSKIIKKRNYVDFGAKITIKNLKDDSTKKFIIKEMEFKPLIQELTMNKTINYEFEYMGEKYKIIEINYNY